MVLGSSNAVKSVRACRYVLGAPTLTYGIAGLTAVAEPQGVALAAAVAAAVVAVIVAVEDANDVE